MQYVEETGKYKRVFLVNTEGDPIKELDDLLKYGKAIELPGQDFYDIEYKALDATKDLTHPRIQKLARKIC